MNNRKAIDIIKNLPIYRYELDYDKKSDLMKALELAIAALDKGIQKTPCYSGDGYWNGELVYDTWQCPNCDEYYEVDYDNYDYCPKCGQAIKKEY